MQLVGATHWFIRCPYILEGFFHGFLGALLALILLWVSYGQVVLYVQKQLPFIPFLSVRMVLFQLTLILIITGSFLGVFASLMSLRRFLMDTAG